MDLCRLAICPTIQSMPPSTPTVQIFTTSPRSRLMVNDPRYGCSHKLIFFSELFYLLIKQNRVKSSVHKIHISHFKFRLSIKLGLHKQWLCCLQLLGEGGNRFFMIMMFLLILLIFIDFDSQASRLQRQRDARRREKNKHKPSKNRKTSKIGFSKIETFVWGKVNIINIQ